jgi:hypothetical protein
VVVAGAAVVIAGALDVVVWLVVAGPAQAAMREISNNVSTIVKIKLFFLDIFLLLLYSSQAINLAVFL